ncbi:MAG: hypothetical protein M1817_000126 [Caeruleum heppii]|nr:MAG: hypothetical protein M1817_000126 [Caeruleum heppii]
MQFSFATVLMLAAASMATPIKDQSCPTDLSGPFEFPHLIIPLNSSEGWDSNKPVGNTLFPEITPTVSTIFNFDLPPTTAGHICSVVFLFPLQHELQTSSYDFHGNGKVHFSFLDGVANHETTVANAPPIHHEYGAPTITPGGSYLIASYPCPAGERISIKAAASGDTHLKYFQDYNPKPIGLYITVCKGA